MFTRSKIVYREGWSEYGIVYDGEVVDQRTFFKRLKVPFNGMSKESVGFVARDMREYEKMGRLAKKISDSFSVSRGK